VEIHLYSIILVFPEINKKYGTINTGTKTNPLLKNFVYTIVTAIYIFNGVNLIRTLRTKKYRNKLLKWTEGIFYTPVPLVIPLFCKNIHITIFVPVIEYHQ